MDLSRRGGRGRKKKRKLERVDRVQTGQWMSKRTPRWCDDWFLDSCFLARFLSFVCFPILPLFTSVHIFFVAYFSASLPAFSFSYFEKVSKRVGGECFGSGSGRRLFSSFLSSSRNKNGVGLLRAAQSLRAHKINFGKWVTRPGRHRRRFVFDKN